MPEKKPLTDPSGEDWFVAKYALEDNEIGWYQIGDLTEGEQRSLVYYLLNNLDGMTEENTLSEIIRHKPQLLDFYRKDLLKDVEQIRELGILDIENWWNLAKGASDSETDLIAAQFDTHEKEVIELLLGAGTDYALQQLAHLVKDSERLIKDLEQQHVIVRKDGTIELRFLPDAYSLFKADDACETCVLPEGLELLIDSKKAVEGGKIASCNNQIPALLNIDFTKVAPFKGSALEKIGSYHFFSSNCEACDTWLNSNVFKINHREPWTFLGTYIHYTENPIYHFETDPEEVDCDPVSAEPLDDDVPAKLWYTPSEVSKEHYDRIATLGGRPYWVQSPEVPHCPECQKLMFYVGQNQASEWSGSIGDQVVFGFVCEDCMRAVQVMQCT